MANMIPTNNKFTPIKYILSLVLIVCISLILPQKVQGGPQPTIPAPVYSQTPHLATKTPTQTPLPKKSFTASPQFTTFTPTKTSTLTPTQTITATFTITITFTPTPSVTPTAIPAIPELLASPPYRTLLQFALFGLVVFFIGLFTARYLMQIPLERSYKTKLETNSTKKTPQPIFDVKPISSGNLDEIAGNELNSELENGLSILLELYKAVSKNQNRVFVPIADLKSLFEKRYPEKNEIDLQQIAIEIANTKGGLLKIQQSRYEGYLVKVIYNDEGKGN